MRRIRLHYNAPVVLTFSMLAAAVLVLDHWFRGVLIPRLFVTAPPFSTAEAKAENPLPLNIPEQSEISRPNLRSGLSVPYFSIASS